MMKFKNINKRFLYPMDFKAEKSNIVFIPVITTLSRLAELQDYG
jgi:hypothetical protein